MKQTILAILSFPLVSLLATGSFAQEEAPKKPVQVLTQDGYDLTSPAVVKIVSDAGRKIGAGVLVGVHKDNVGFVLTSYSMVAGRDKVAIILKNFPDALLGYVVDKWIDFDLDLAVVGIKNFPPGQMMVTLGPDSKLDSSKVVTAVTHAEDGDWAPLPTMVKAIDERGFAFQLDQSADPEGSPILNEKGYMVGLTVSDDATSIASFPSDFAVRSSAVKPILKEWFKGVDLKQKWREKGAGIATWIWAVGGSVVSGTVATVFAISGGGGGGGGALPRPPDPPKSGQ